MITLCSVRAKLLVLASLLLIGVFLLRNNLFAVKERAFHSESARIQQLIEGGGMTESDMRLLQSLGSESLLYIIPSLTRHETFKERAYASFYRALPAAWQQRLSPPVDVESIRANAAILAGLLGPKARLAVPYLVELLQDNSANANAAVSLGQIGPDAVEAVPALMRAVQNGVPFAALALAKIGNPAETLLGRLARQGPVWQQTECAHAFAQLTNRPDHPLTDTTSAFVLILK